MIKTGMISDQTFNDSIIKRLLSVLIRSRYLYLCSILSTIILQEIEDLIVRIIAV